MVAVSPSLLLLTSGALILGTVVFGSAVRHRLRSIRYEEKRRQLAAVQAAQFHASDWTSFTTSMGNGNGKRATRVIRIRSDPLNSESLSVFNDNSVMIYSLQRKSSSYPNIWLLVNQSRLVVGEINLTPSYLLNTPGHRQTAVIELINPTLGLRYVSLKRRIFPGNPNFLDFDYLGTTFSWNKNSQLLTASEEIKHRSRTSTKDTDNDVSPANLPPLADEATIAIVKSLKLVASDYEICFDPLVIDDETLIATSFVAIMTPWEPALSLGRLLSLVKSSSTIDANV